MPLWYPFAEKLKLIRLDAQLNDFTFVVPASHTLLAIFFQNITANAMLTGGIKIGTTPGGVEVLASFNIGALVRATIPSALLLKTTFNMEPEPDVTLYIQDVLGWNNAVINFQFSLIDLRP